MKQSGSSIARAGEKGHVNNHWIGKTYAELRKEFGPAETSIDTTLKGGPASTGYVYTSTRGDGCIDAFVVQDRTQQIIDYFCR